jgi:hypothetical protein
MAGRSTFSVRRAGSTTRCQPKGILSRDFGSNTNQSNNPQIFTGSVGHVVPKPTSWILLGIGSFDCGWLMPEPRGVIDLSLKVLSASNCYFVASSGMFTG